MAWTRRDHAMSRLAGNLPNARDLTSGAAALRLRDRPCCRRCE